ncbi:hypothetical protein EEB18_010175 [Sphingopyxis sp. OPL5]|nr:hypothetical protein [Sphingopyxis sp. OPL5]QNO29261.1 hypothetical protein EEB18_010175 [Sphingopyxis sp. OPL5]
MTHTTNETNWINRLFAAMIETSATAVAVHYAAPWNDAARGKRTDRN